jgi:hypothetical protein
LAIGNSHKPNQVLKKAFIDEWKMLAKEGMIGERKETGVRRKHQ